MPSVNGLNTICMFGMCFLELWSLLHNNIYSAPQSTQCATSKTNPLQVKMHFANCINSMLWNLPRRDGRGGPRTEVFFAQNNGTKMELETEQQIHFRSVIKLSELPPMEDSDVSINSAGGSVRVLVVQILFSVALCAGDVWNKRNGQLKTGKLQYFTAYIYLQNPGTLK